MSLDIEAEFPGPRISFAKKKLKTRSWAHKALGQISGYPNKTQSS